MLSEKFTEWRDGAVRDPSQTLGGSLAPRSQVSRDLSEVRECTRHISIHNREGTCGKSESHWPGRASGIIYSMVPRQAFH